MHCPFCRHSDSRVIDSRTADDGMSIRRRRNCPECGKRFTTTETASLTVIKRSGVVEPFSREKVMVGVRKACQGRPVTEADLALLAQRVEESLRLTGVAQFDTNDIGVAILPHLRELDEVAYLRFASVYQAFESLGDFEAAIRDLRAASGPAGDESRSADAQRAKDPQRQKESQRQKDPQRQKDAQRPAKPKATAASAPAASAPASTPGEDRA